MRLAILLSLALCGTPLIAASSLREAPARALQEEESDGVCSFDIEVDGTCTLNNVRAVVTDPDCDLRGDRALKNEVRTACRRAIRAADAGETNLEDRIDAIEGSFDRQDLDNYFNGGTYLNENTGTVDDEAPFIQDIYDTQAQTSTIPFPTYINNFAGCRYKAVVCLWVRDRQANDDNGNCREPLENRCRDANPADNTDVCYVDASRNPRAAHVPEGVAFFPDNAEGATHAHGFAWKNRAQSAGFRGNLLFYISMYDHLQQRGYAENLGLAPMCGCIEDMPTISRADCTQADIVSETWAVSFADGAASASRTDVEIEFNACDGETNNDLYSELEQLYGDNLKEEVRDYLVGPEDNGEPSNCPNDESEL